jgi:Glycosyltransferase family 87
MRELIRTRPLVTLALTAAAVFVLACAAIPGGLVRGGEYGDVQLYAHDAKAILDGQVPYRDFTLEYPPGSLAAFLPPAVSLGHYTELFRVLMTLCGAVAVLLATPLVALRGRHVAAAALAACALAPLAFGPIVVNEYDFWPTLLTVVALLAFVRDRHSLGGALLGVGAATKIFPGAILPAALVWVYRRRGRRAALRSLAWFAGAAGLLYLAFGSVAPGGVWFSIKLQATRGLQKESLGAAVLFALDQLGAYKAHIVEGNHTWTELTGRAGDALATASMLCEALVALGVARVVALRRPEPRTLVLAAATAVTGFVAFGKVLSPQYLVWLVPLVPLAGGLLDSMILACALLVTQLWFLGVLTPFALGPQVWLVVARDGALLLLVALLFRRLLASEPGAPRRESRTTPREAGPVRAAPT